MAKSIVSNAKRCYVCGATSGLHLHHIFYGNANRRQSDKFGCVVYLCGYHHNMSAKGVHSDRTLDTKLKQECQTKFEERYGHEMFMQIFGKNYL